MKYKVGDRVRIKSIDWYNENKNEYGNVKCHLYEFSATMRQYCGTIRTIRRVDNFDKMYKMVEDGCHFDWTDEMIEGLVEEEAKPIDLTVKGEETKERIEIVIPEGYEYVIESGKIIFTKKKKEYPKTYEECLKILGFTTIYTPKVEPMFDYDDDIITLQKLKNCRDAYWKIAGEEMGLGKPWKPDWKNDEQFKYIIICRRGRIVKDTYTAKDVILSFPTKEMRDAFYENFKELIEICKELL